MDEKDSTSEAQIGDRLVDVMPPTTTHNTSNIARTRNDSQPPCVNGPMFLKRLLRYGVKLAANGIALDVTLPNPTAQFSKVSLAQF